MLPDDSAQRQVYASVASACVAKGFCADIGPLRLWPGNRLEPLPDHLAPAHSTAATPHRPRALCHNPIARQTEKTWQPKHMVRNAS